MKINDAESVQRRLQEYEPEALVQRNTALHRSRVQHRPLPGFSRLLPNPALVNSLHLRRRDSITTGHPNLQLAALTVAISMLLLRTAPRAAKLATSVPRGDTSPRCVAVDPPRGHHRNGVSKPPDHPVPSGLGDRIVSSPWPCQTPNRISAHRDFTPKLR
ncbi:hypothetical protein MTO96_044516 [Rhipicephalus appendiculatus]